MKTSSTAPGLIEPETNNGWSLGISGPAKAGYKLNASDKPIIPFVGIGPYIRSLQSGSGDESFSNQIFGLSGYVGLEFELKKMIIAPNFQFGIATLGTSDREMGSADNEQNGQPSMFEIGLTLGFR